ncbi:hypothetical protein LCGC14_1167430 [marine sediment metagenome]|uniref:HNH nuclease domain-containing protein n=1 Tax=marine sediment metagenome TaxID=412755 RepID=A0A0F9PWA9_9ZZZZ
MGKWKKGAKPKAARRWRIKTLIKKYRGKCAFCDINVVFTPNVSNQATVDHIVPLSRGGFEEFLNLQLLCRKCNLGKGSSMIDEDGEIIHFQREIL